MSFSNSFSKPSFSSSVGRDASSLSNNVSKGLSSVGKSVNSGVSSVGRTMSRGASNVGDSMHRNFGTRDIGSRIKNSLRNSSTSAMVMGALVIFLLYLYGVSTYVLIMIGLVLACILFGMPISFIGMIIIVVLASYFFHISVFYIAVFLVFAFCVYKGVNPIMMVAIITVIMLVSRFSGSLGGGSSSKYVFPPVDQHDDCPDNWMSMFSTENNTQKPVCHNYKKQPLNTNDPKCQHTMDFNQSQYLGEKGMQNKKDWANDCGVPWGGVDNRVT